MDSLSELQRAAWLILSVCSRHTDSDAVFDTLTHALDLVTQAHDALALTERNR